MEVKVLPTVVVITPTIGQDSLEKAIESVKNQTYTNIRHLIVIDGPHYYGTALNIIDKNMSSEHNVMIATLPENTGGGGFYGHRVYAAFPHLVNEDLVSFLDEDNWWDPDHIQSLVDTFKENKDCAWVHSLRKVYVGDEFLANDCCESIGRWPIAWTADRNDPEYLVDTSSYLFHREFIKQTCHLWHWGWGGDRRFFMLVKDAAPYATSGKHTLNYKLPDMNKAYGGQMDIFEKYNEETKRKYGGYPWN